MSLSNSPVEARYIADMTELATGYEIAVMADEVLNGPEDALRVVTAVQPMFWPSRWLNPVGSSARQRL